MFNRIKNKLKQIYVLLKTNPHTVYRWQRAKDFFWHVKVPKMTVELITELMTDSLKEENSLYRYIVNNSNKTTKRSKSALSSKKKAKSKCAI